MKHHIVFKFLAILLCAASLLGAAAAGAGILVLTEADLYRKTADQAYRDTLEGYAENYARDMAIRFASRELGGAEDSLLQAYYGTDWYYEVFDPEGIGYVISNVQGDYLTDDRLLTGQPEYTFLFQPTGTYLHLLTELTGEEYREATALPEGITTNVEDGYVYNAIPAEGIDVFYVEMHFSDDSQEALNSPEDSLGTLFCHEDGAVEFFSAEGVDLVSDHLDAEMVYVHFRSREGESLYEAARSNGVVREGSYMDGMTHLLLPSPEPVMVYDGIPPEGCAPATVYIARADGSAESIGGTPDVGFLDYDAQGNVQFAFRDLHALTDNGSAVIHIRFQDAQGNVLYEARDPEGVGSFLVENEIRYFRTGVEAPVPEEPAPEASPAAPLSGTVKAYSNIYACASLTSPVVGFVTAGSPVEIGQQVTEAGLDWGWIPGSGWVLMDSISLTAEASPEDVPANGDPELKEELLLAEVQEKLDIHVACDSMSEVVGSYEAGDIVSVIRQKTLDAETWALTDQGWISMALLIPVEIPVTEFELISLEESGAEETTIPQETTAEATEMTIEASVPVEATEAVITASLPAEGETYSYYDPASQQQKYVQLTYEELPALTVEVQLAPGAFRYSQDWTLIRLLYSVKDYLIWILAGLLLLFAVLAVYLCCAAGKKPGSREIRAGGLNAIPLELYGSICTAGAVALGFLGVEGTRYLLRSDILNGILCAALCGYGICVLVTAFCFACAAQFKTPGGYWWRNTLVGRCLFLAGKGGRLLLKGAEKLDGKWEKTLWPGLRKLFLGLTAVVTVVVKKLWNKLLQLLRLGRALLKKLFHAWNRFISLLPLTWQWLLAGGAMIFFLFVTVAGRYDTGIVLSILFAVALVIYGAHCFGSLLDSTKRMSKGDLDEKVDDKLMVGSFREFAGELNGLADVAVVAAQKQLKSERMKTELITNVSHDIKTPLTSIINYVDLLQKPHSPEDAEKYLEVLDRQSQRLKKLIDDLMEMSKASTGNMSVDIDCVNAAEAVNQALGEFADKLEQARLYPVFRKPEEPVYMWADGRLVWRVMSNLLSNAVKYALPGTRLYVDLQKVDSKVIISLKNISREELNVDAEELMERFVRGDTSRNTEGSGLGLNIAQSLMELQRGQMQILVDGDLFKVTLLFPGE